MLWPAGCAFCSQLWTALSGSKTTKTPRGSLIQSCAACGRCQHLTFDLIWNTCTAHQQNSKCPQPLYLHTVTAIRTLWFYLINKTDNGIKDFMSLCPIFSFAWSSIFSGILESFKWALMKGTLKDATLLDSEATTILKHCLLAFWLRINRCVRCK